RRPRLWSLDARGACGGECGRDHEETRKSADEQRATTSRAGHRLKAKHTLQDDLQLREYGSGAIALVRVLYLGGEGGTPPWSSPRPGGTHPAKKRRKNPGGGDGKFAGQADVAAR